MTRTAPRAFKRLSREIVFRIGDLLMQKKEAIAEMTSSEVAAMIRREFSVGVTNETVRKLINDRGLTYSKRRAVVTRDQHRADTHARDAILAKSIRHLASELDCELPLAVELHEIIARRTPGSENGQAESNGGLFKKDD